MPRFAYGKSADNAREENMSMPCLECYYRRLLRDSPHCAACDASGSGFSFDAHGEQKSTYGLCLQCGTYHVSGEQCPVIYRIEPKLDKPIDFNFYWEIVSAWFLDFKPRVSIHQLRGLCERLTTITASNIGLDPIEALHCGETPNTDFNLTQPAESQVKS